MPIGPEMKIISGQELVRSLSTSGAHHLDTIQSVTAKSASYVELRRILLATGSKEKSETFIMPDNVGTISWTVVLQGPKSSNVLA